jgi:hypothetical protein
MPKTVDALLTYVKALSENVEKLTKHVQDLQNENRNLHQQLMTQISDSREQNPVSTSSSTNILEEAVSASLKSALREEKTKCEVVLALPENKQDTKDIEEMCQRLQISTRPSALTRMGESSTSNKARPLKATFASHFDARLFLAKVGENNHNAENPAIRCRPCRSSKEQARYMTLRPQVKSLNDTARENGVNESFSIRQNGEVWRFTKRENGKWRRDVNWKLASSPALEPQSPSDATPGNESGTPST